MALYGSDEDISLFLKINRELLGDIIEQKVGYYKRNLKTTEVNSYGETEDVGANFYPPVLLDCLIDRGSYTGTVGEAGPDFIRDIGYRFLRQDLIDSNVVPEQGDVILFEDNYYEADTIDENQLILGKNDDYAYADHITNFGRSWSIIVFTHYVSPDSLGIIKSRL